MTPFVIGITLAALLGPDVYFSVQQQDFKDEAACEMALVKLEDAVQVLIRRDPSVLAIIGNVSGDVTRAYFVKEGDCEEDEE